MSDPFARWEPDRNAVHRLIQLLDVLAIAFNRFRQLSFQLPEPDTSADWQVALDRLRHDYSEIVRAVCPREDTAPQYTALTLADEAVAELVRAGVRDQEAVVRRAQQLFTALGWCSPRPAPHSPHCETWKAFNGEGELLTDYLAVRPALLAALARTGQTVPRSIRRRDAEAFKPLVYDGEQPIPNSVLLGWVAETEPASNLYPSGQSDALRGVVGDSGTADGIAGPAKRVAANPLAVDRPSGCRPKKGGRKRVGESKRDPKDRLKRQIYDRVQREHKAGCVGQALLTRLRADRQFADQVRDAGLTLNGKLIKAALEDARRAATKHET
jgi:hypothetical protein